MGESLAAVEIMVAFTTIVGRRCSAFSSLDAAAEAWGGGGDYCPPTVRFEVGGGGQEYLFASPPPHVLGDKINIIFLVQNSVSERNSELEM